MDFRIFWVIYLLCIGVLLAAIAGCGGGGGGDGGGASAPGPLAGTWFGSAEDSAGQLHAVKMTIANSRVTALEVDGVDQGGSGPLAQDEPTVFSSVMTFPGGQAQVVLFADPAGAHFVYLDNFFRFGVLQKGATALPQYSTIDINGTWKGASVFTDFHEYDGGPSSAICIVGTCSVTEVDDRMTEAFTQGFDSVYGRWLGSTVINLPGVPDINKVSRVFVSPDKKFAGVWRCLVGATGDILFPGKCTYSVWVKS